jgi:CheY-like chemotaxis protein
MGDTFLHLNISARRGFLIPALLLFFAVFVVGWFVGKFAGIMKKYFATILVVEDDKNDQMLIERAFRRVEVKGPIHIANDGAEAIAYMMGEGKYADREKFAYPTFIITDLKMPRVDGFGVLEFLKGNPEWAIIPTVVFSASHDPDDIKKAYMLGASSYHIKPDNPEELRHQLATLHAYWLTCEVPEVDITGKQVSTHSEGKLGERFVQPCDAPDASKETGPERVVAGDTKG